MIDLDKIKQKLDSVYSTMVIANDGRGLNGVFAGGCITSIINGEEPKDYDFFSVQYSNNGTSSLAHKKEHRLGLSNYAVSVNVDNCVIQLVDIRNDCPDGLSVIKDFDFLHTQNFYCPVTKQLVITNISNVINKKLELNPSVFEKFKETYKPQISSISTTLYRVRKFKKRGFSNCDEVEEQLLQFNFDNMNKIDNKYLNVVNKNNLIKAIGDLIS